MDKWEDEITADYSNIWYNSTIDHLTLEGIEIDFMDGTKAVFTKEQSDEMIYKKPDKQENKDGI